ncbi:hypothetical protein PHJA_000144900 [Phtheirospermum japonicum]|uniref:GIL1/IRKI C-terminal domain-containing protein n=1 Tax=Phtheirospermum japonicum TaxID=374723 RepID=A0A830B796_9LAMI|nr:hypothetical protein PHJA_000144900 [Phtheirospermum japonicum]
MADRYREHCEIGKIENGEISRRDIQAAIAKTVELRALHAALMAGDSPANLRFPSAAASPVSRHARNLSAQEYPVFTPSYNDEPLPGYQQIRMENRNYAESWGEHTIDGPNIDETTNLEGHVCPAEEQKSMSNNINALRSSIGPGYPKSRRNSMEDIQSVSSCNNCRPAIISSESDGPTKNGTRKSNLVVPLTDSHLSLHSNKPRSKNMVLSWLLPKLKRKNKSEYSPARTQTPDDISQMLNDLGIVSIDNLKRELTEANESKNAALAEVTEMRSSLGELRQKLEYLETYCEELKKALKHTKIGKPIENEEKMVEGFMQIVSEARLSVKQFCKTLLGQIEENNNNDITLVDNLNSMLLPYKLSVNSKYSRAVLYHLEAFINRSLYQDFENCVFRKNGAPKLLDPQQDRVARFQSFVSLRNLSWNEVLRKGTKCYSEEFSKFCDQKMNGIVTTLGCTRPWPEQLLQAFFVAAKCIWLLHLLAFSFKQPLGIMRVDENVIFESSYMEDIFAERQRSEGPGRVKIMVMPGFYVLDSVLKCKVLCRYKSVLSS